MKYEIIGTIGSVLVILSFIMSGEKKIRLLNLISSVFFLVYGLLIQAYSIIGLNLLLIVINIYKLRVKG